MEMACHVSKDKARIVPSAGRIMECFVLHIGSFRAKRKLSSRLDNLMCSINACVHSKKYLLK
jgi:hypothetical protein